MSYNNWTAAKIYHLPVDGAVASMAAGPLYAAPSKYGKQDSVCLAPPGVLVIADEARLMALDVPNLATLNPGSFHFGVGVSLKNNGVSDYIRWSNEVGANSLDSYDSNLSSCGQCAIVDLYFDCVVRGKSYTIEVVTKNNDSDSFGRLNQGWRWSFTYTPGYDDCAECDDTVSCDELMCGLYNQINKLDAPGEWDVKLNGEPVPADYDFPFWVDKLYDGATGAEMTTGEYALAPDTTDDTDCVNCLNYQCIGGIDANGIVELFPTQYKIDIGANSYSRASHMEAIANQITAHLAGSGQASVVACAGTCCDIKLEVNTCYENDGTVGAGKFALLDCDGVVIPPTATSNPFTDVAVYQPCEDCDNPAATRKFSCGLRFHAKPIEAECECIGGNNVPREVVTEIEIYAVSGFSEVGGAHIITKQKAYEPEGQGYKWQVNERQSLERGRGEAVEEWLFGGRYGVPVGADIRNRLLTNCGEDYCVLSLRSTYRGHDDKNSGMERQPTNITYLLLSKAESGTLATELQLAFSAYFNGGKYVNFSQVCGF